jgi:hypothetical protein
MLTRFYRALTKSIQGHDIKKWNHVTQPTNGSAGRGDHRFGNGHKAKAGPPARSRPRQRALMMIARCGQRLLLNYTAATKNCNDAFNSDCGASMCATGCYSQHQLDRQDKASTAMHTNATVHSPDTSDMRDASSTYITQRTQNLMISRT